MLLWPWCRLAATAPIQPLRWELPYAVGLALKSKKKKKPTNEKNCHDNCMTVVPLKISYCNVLALLVMMRDDKMPT